MQMVDRVVALSAVRTSCVHPEVCDCLYSVICRWREAKEDFLKALQLDAEQIEGQCCSAQ